MKNPNRGARRLLLLAATLVVAGGAWLLGAQQEGDYTKVAGAPAPTAEYRVEAGAADSVTAKPEQDPRAAESATDEPLPPAAPFASAAMPMNYRDMPVVELLDLLGERARAGDPVASCRLGHALNECRVHFLITRARATFHPRSPPSDSRELERFIEQEAARQEKTARVARRCVGLSRAALHEGLAFSARAALAGHSASLTDFLKAPSTVPADFILDSQLAEVYRTELWPALQRALRAGDPQVSMALLNELANPVPTSIHAAVPEQYQDPEVALAMRALLFGEEAHLMPSFAARNPPSVEAVETATQWVDDLFGGRVPDLSKANLARVRDATSRRGSNCDSASAWLPR